MAASPHLCLRWNNYQSNLTSVFDQLLQNETFVDVTLAADGHAIKAHRMVLSACSPYFQALFFDNPCQHPIVILKDTRWSELKAIVEYMYRGEISVAQEELSSLLRVAETLKIRGLSELNNSERRATEAPDDRSDSASPLVATAITSATPTGLDNRRTTSPSTSWPQQQQPANWSREETPTPSPRPTKRRRGSVTERSTPGGSPAGSTPASVVAQQHEEGSLEGPLSLVGHAHSTSANVSAFPQQQQQQQPAPVMQPASTADDLDIKPGIAELIREEERARMLEGAHPWLTTSSSVLSDSLGQWRSKAPSWSKEQLQEAIQAIVTQRMRFTQASAHYSIPKGTLYDNILGKSKRMLVLDEVALDDADEEAVLDFCCETSVMPYNRRTNKSLESIISFVEKLKQSKGKSNFKMSGLMGFRWWWAFCKKHNIVSLFYAKGKAAAAPAAPAPSSPAPLLQHHHHHHNNNSSNNNNNVPDKVTTKLQSTLDDDEETVKKLSFYRNINNNLHLNHLRLSQALLACHNQQQQQRSRNHSVEQDDESDPEPENLSLNKH